MQSGRGNLMPLTGLLRLPDEIGAPRKDGWVVTLRRLLRSTGEESRLLARTKEAKFHRGAETYACMMAQGAFCYNIRPTGRDVGALSRQMNGGS